MRNSKGQFISENKYKNSPLYEVWYSMKKRCENPKAINYNRYGGRGITICSEWSNSLDAFCEWAIKNGWQKGLQLDRIDNQKGYSPENCRFATVKEQANNRRSNVLITFNGKTQTLKMWAEEMGLEYRTLRLRLCKLGWSIKEALQRPTRPHKQYKNRRL